MHMLRISPFENSPPVNKTVDAAVTVLLAPRSYKVLKFHFISVMLFSSPTYCLTLSCDLLSQRRASVATAVVQTVRNEKY